MAVKGTGRQTRMDNGGSLIFAFVEGQTIPNATLGKVTCLDDSD